ncbi:hypothetical protein [Anaerosalibacter sp. Marseille-P3206]|uniref:hypothetical protein n=1 Tax=Anaerosalibacter sp. Marseille-P3206 TaxID=1871005 RepID=UPI0013566659|nr:hypothetical protein [Anaerosalibacter sp. Marseille-P3206]
MKKGILKYVPDKWFKRKKPRFVTNFTDHNGVIVGKGVGIFTDYNELTKEEYIQGIISINKIKSDEDKFLVLDNLYLLTVEDINYIENETGLSVIDGKDARVYFLTYVLKEIHNFLGEDLTKKEILIISDESSKTYKLILNLSKEVRFLTVTGEDEEEIKQIAEDVYNNTGLSIFFSKNINRILTNYNIIINLKDNVSLDLKNIRSKTIIFDLSLEKNLSKALEKFNSSLVIIKDFLFTYDHFIMESELFEDKGEIPSYKYEAFKDYNVDDFEKVVVHDKDYSIKELVDNKIRYRIPIKGLDNKK